MPRLVVRRKAREGVLVSTFVGIIEPYENDSSIQNIRRLPLLSDHGRPYPDSSVAVEVTHVDGTQDLIVAGDVENPLGKTPSLKTTGVLVQKDWQLVLNGEFCLVRKSKDGKVVYMCASHTQSVCIEEQQFDNEDPKKLLEWKNR